MASTNRRAIVWQRRIFRGPAVPSGHTRAGLPYCVAHPADWKPGGKYPLLVHLHGSGERGDDNRTQLTHCRDFLENAVRHRHAVVVAPQCAPQHQWVEVSWKVRTHNMPSIPSVPMGLLFVLLPQIENEFRTDPARRYLMGLSMGGMGVWDALCRRPDYFTAAVPLCGTADEKQAPRIAHIPVWVWHGEKDAEIRVRRSRNIVAALKAAGGSPRYTECPGVGHNVWEFATADKDLPEWLFAQKRSATTAPTNP